MGRKEPQQAPLIRKNGPFGILGAHSFYQLLTLGQVLMHRQVTKLCRGCTACGAAGSDCLHLLLC
jgi:hypothetical protein